MGRGRMSQSSYRSVHSTATSGGTRSATHVAEERSKKGEGLDPLVDPKGPSHLGPIRYSRPRFIKEGNFWKLTCGMPMAEETLLDTTGSMGGNVDVAFKVLPDTYAMLISGSNPVLGRYDLQMATGIFNDVDDGIPVLCRSQFEMDEKIAMQMTNMVPGRMGCGNHKEDPQFGLFGAAYLTSAWINRYVGMRTYHFTISDEPTCENVDFRSLKRIYGDDVLDRVKENGYNISSRNMPDTGKVVQDLQTRAHAFFLFVPGHQYDERRAREQWEEYYGEQHMITLPNGARLLHYVKACIIGLTEGVLDLMSLKDFLAEHGLRGSDAQNIIRAISHIPTGAQMEAPDFERIPKKGDLFREKTDLWPIDPSEAPQDSSEDNSGDTGDSGGPEWL